MAAFVHIADERDASSILRTGLKLPRKAKLVPGDRPVGVFALPVVPNFMLSHQWVRELKKRGFKVAVGVYFRIPDDEPVWAGLYNEAKLAMSAAQATSRLLVEGALGFEAIIPRSIRSKEIRAVRPLPQTVGWRHFPAAHERGIFCGCEYCQRGEIKSRGIRERYRQGEL